LDINKLDMDVSKIELELESIGLNRSEIKVYLALLKIGAQAQVNNNRVENRKFQSL